MLSGQAVLPAPRSPLSGGSSTLSPERRPAAVLISLVLASSWPASAHGFDFVLGGILQVALLASSLLGLGILILSRAPWWHRAIGAATVMVSIVAAYLINSPPQDTLEGWVAVLLPPVTGAFTLRALRHARGAT